MENKLCPMKFNLGSYDNPNTWWKLECEKETCAWWDEGQCIIKTIGMELLGIEQQLIEIRKENRNGKQ